MEHSRNQMLPDLLYWGLSNMQGWCVFTSIVMCSSTIQNVSSACCVLHWWKGFCFFLEKGQCCCHHLFPLSFVRNSIWLQISHHEPCNGERTALRVTTSSVSLLQSQAIWTPAQLMLPVFLVRISARSGSRAEALACLWRSVKENAAVLVCKQILAD